MGPLHLTWLFGSIASAVFTGPATRELDAHSFLQSTVDTHASRTSSLEPSARKGQGKTWRHGAKMPTFVIDMDVPPQERWREPTEYYREVIPYMLREYKRTYDMTFSKSDQQAWSAEFPHIFPEESQAELQGLADLFDDPFITKDLISAWSSLYELGSPTVNACSGVIAAMPNGTVVHGRNMDYRFRFTGPGGVRLDWPDITYEATFVRGGKPIMKGAMWPMHFFGASMLRLADETGSGWDFQQNTRSGNDMAHNLAAIRAGARFYALVVRESMLKTADYNTALKWISSASYAAPQYFIMAGGNPYEGAVLTVDRLGKHLETSPEIHTLSASNWEEVQTNDDLNKAPDDNRRPRMNAKLQEASQSHVDRDFVKMVMTTHPAKNSATVYTTVSIAATGYYETIVHL